jgi:hypothetical protein
MGKYEPLGQFLRKQKADRIPMTFTEIERVIGAKLPPSKKSRAFWSNNPDNNVMTREWTSAGFATDGVDLKANRLVFLRKAKSPRKKRPAKGKWEQLYGCMKDKIVSAPGTDVSFKPYTEEEWEEIEVEWLRSWDELMRRDPA